MKCAIYFFLFLQVKHSMDHIPKDVVFAAKRLANYNRNRFRLETVSAETAGPGRIVTVNLPPNAEGVALLDMMKSFKWHFDVACTEVHWWAEFHLDFQIGAITAIHAIPRPRAEKKSSEFHPE